MLGQTHMLGVIHAFDLAKGKSVRFRDLSAQLQISPKTLSARLRTLVEAGFLTRRSYNEIPPRVEYEPTRKIAELAPVFALLGGWAARNSLTAVPVVSVTGKVSSPTRMPALESGTA